MRGLGVSLLALLLVPGAIAQSPTHARFDVEAPPGPVRPLVDTLELNYTVDVLCEPALPARGPARIAVWVEAAPPWATLVVEPDVTEVGPCQGERFVARGIVKLQVSDQAPAMSADSFTLAAASEGISGNATGRATLPLTAAYFGILDLQIAESIRVVEPGERAEFPIKVSNLGNGRGRVTFELVEASEGIAVEVPAPVVLESKQQGGNAISQTVGFVMVGARGGLYLNEVAVAQLRATLVHELDGAFGGEGTVSTLLTTRGLAAPGPDALSLVLAMAFALGLTRRRRSRASRARR